MSTVHTILTILEVLMIVAIIVCFIYEPVIAQWEHKQGKKMLKAFNKRKELRK